MRPNGRVYRMKSLGKCVTDTTCINTNDIARAPWHASAEMEPRKLSTTPKYFENRIICLSNTTITPS